MLLCIFEASAQSYKVNEFIRESRKGTDTLFFKAVYQGKNLCIQNPLDTLTGTYPVKQVWLNKDRLQDTVTNKAFFEIKLDHFRVNESVDIVLIGDIDKFVVFNPQVIVPKALFRFTSFTADEDYITFVTRWSLGWRTYYQLQRYEQNGWRILRDSIITNDMGEGSAHSYIAVSDTNVLRLKAYGTITDDCVYSPIIKYVSKKPKLDILEREASDVIVLSSITEYRLINHDGDLIHKGYSDKVPVADLSKGTYYIEADNRIFTIYVSPENPAHHYIEQEEPLRQVITARTQKLKKFINREYIVPVFKKSRVVQTVARTFIEPVLWVGGIITFVVGGALLFKFKHRIRRKRK